MNYAISISIIVLCLVAIALAYKFFKKRQSIAIKERIFPKDILEKFNEAENKLKGGIEKNEETRSPYGILWRIARCRKEPRDNERDGSPKATESTVSNRELHEQSNRREDIQTRTTTNIVEDKPIIRRVKQNNFRRIISRIRRK